MNDMKLHKKIEMLQQSSGLSVRQFAARLRDVSGDKVSANTVSRWMDGKISPRVDQVAKLAEMCDVSLTYLVDDSLDKEGESPFSEEQHKKLELLKGLDYEEVLQVFTRLVKERLVGSDLEGESRSPVYGKILGSSKLPPLTKKADGDDKAAPAADLPARRK